MSLVKSDNVADIKDDNLKPLDNSVPAFPGSDDDDFEPKIITDPNLKPKVDLEARVITNNEKLIIFVFDRKCVGGAKFMIIFGISEFD